MIVWVFFLTLLILFSIFSLHATKNIEGYELKNTVNIQELQSVRSFLEEMYSICIKLENDLVDGNLNTMCYKCSILGIYIPAQLKIEDKSMEELWKYYGQAAICPPDGVCDEKNDSKRLDNIVPLLSNQKDYFMLIQLITSAKALSPFIKSTTNPIWGYENRVIVPEQPATEQQSAVPEERGNVLKDVCSLTDNASRTIVAQVTLLYKKIYEALEYFHSQADQIDSGKNGDVIETKAF
jgi:hypothetical protein